MLAGCVVRQHDGREVGGWCGVSGIWGLGDGAGKDGFGRLIGVKVDIWRGEGLMGAKYRSVYTPILSMRR